MAGEDIKRRLAAILSADVVGYSRLMGKDEAGTLAALKTLRKELFAPTVAGHHGRIVKLMGDGALVEFPSVVEAVGHTGMFDYVEYAAEYVPWDLDGMENFCRTTELYNLGGMIKVDHEFEAMLTQRSIGCGFNSVLFANVESVDEAKECIAAIRPTRGISLPFRP